MKPLFSETSLLVKFFVVPPVIRSRAGTFEIGGQRVELRFPIKTSICHCSRERFEIPLTPLVVGG